MSDEWRQTTRHWTSSGTAAPAPRPFRWGLALEASDRLLTPGEVATLFRVDPKTVTRWAAAGRISSIRTPGGHRRFRESEVRLLLSGDEAAAGLSAPPEPRTPESG